MWISYLLGIFIGGLILFIVLNLIIDGIDGWFDGFMEFFQGEKKD